MVGTRPTGRWCWSYPIRKQTTWPFLPLPLAVLWTELQRILLLEVKLKPILILYCYFKTRKNNSLLLSPNCIKWSLDQWDISPLHSSIIILIGAFPLHSHTIKVLEHPKKECKKYFYNNWEISCSLINKPVVWPLAWHKCQIFSQWNWYLLSVVNECTGIACYWWEIVCQFIYSIIFVSFPLAEKMDPFLLFFFVLL